MLRGAKGLRKDLDEWFDGYNNERMHQGKRCCGRTVMQTFLDAKLRWNEKVNQLNERGGQLPGKL